MTRYTYGDSDLAAERLGLVAKVFEPASRAFLRAASPDAPRLALDLGCGPGHTTALVHEASGAARTAGLDRSEAFVGRARGAAAAGVTFVAHDVTVTPFPTGPADLIYARLLLAHLPDPVGIVRRWSAMLTIGGRLLIDDLESIETDEPVFRTYLDEVAIPVVRAQGGHLLVGPVVHEAADPPGLRRVHDELTSFEPPAATTARIFAMNLAVLVDRGAAPARPDLAAALAALAEGGPVRAVRWTLRQIAFERPDTLA